MKLLLDSHTFLWLSSMPQNLSSQALIACSDPNNQLYLSLASIWEMQIKWQLGKLQLPDTLPNIVHKMQVGSAILLLSLRLDHIWNLSQLPLHHRDPFDRIMIAQAISHNFTLVSRDPWMKAYPVKLLW